MPTYYARTWIPVDSEDSPDNGPEVAVWDHVFADVCLHSGTDHLNEVAGLLLGSTVDSPNGDGSVVVIEASLPAKHVQSGATHVEFTHDTWAAFHEERESRFANMRIVGWYHTHPNIGLFLSRYDTFIHENFFKEADRVALVLDPVNGTSGFFKRVAGFLDPVRCYGFTEISGSEAPGISPGDNMQMESQSRAEESSLPAEIYPREPQPEREPVEAAGYERRGQGGIFEMLALAVRDFWRNPDVTRVLGGLVAWFLGRSAPGTPTSSGPQADPSEDEMAALRAQLAEERRHRAEAEERAATASRELAGLRGFLADRVRDVAFGFGMRAAWAMVATVAFVMLVAAVLIAPVPPLSGDAGGWPRWVAAGAVLASTAGWLAASTSSTLGPLSAGLAARWGAALGERLERTLLRLFHLG